MLNTGSGVVHGKLLGGYYREMFGGSTCLLACGFKVSLHSGLRFIWQDKIFVAFIKDSGPPSMTSSLCYKNYS